MYVYSPHDPYSPTHFLRHLIAGQDAARSCRSGQQENKRLGQQKKGNGKVVTPSEEPDPLDVLKFDLEQLLSALNTKDIRNLSESVAADVKQYDDARYLDTSFVCFPNLLAPGEAKIAEVRSAVTQVTIYMRQQRRTQSWLRFCLGLVATKDKMGLLRADATGVEECIFPKNQGRGVIEAIRLSLGILLATDEELGQHPSFSLRSVKIANADYEKDHPIAAVGTKRPAIGDDDEGNSRNSKKQRSQTSNKKGSDSPTYPSRPKYFTSREVNWIVIDDKPRLSRTSHGTFTGETRTTFYVKYLVEDRGSLVGRCTRVWCVYQEVTESDPIVIQHQIPKGRRIFQGPYALKVYNADIYTEAYEKNILAEVMNNPIRGVLLPTEYGIFRSQHLIARVDYFDAAFGISVRS